MSSTRSSTAVPIAAAAAAALGCALMQQAFVQSPGPAAQAVNPNLRGQSAAVQQSSMASPASSSASATPLLGLGAAAGAAGILASQQRAKGAKANKSSAVPLRAFESELGVQAPLGFWDPIGYTADGDAVAFARRRQTELKHGRIAMLATMGYITPELTGKFPGYLSPSMSLKFEDVPNGLAAISKVPAAGWAQMLAYASFCEISQDQSAGTPAAAGDFGFKVLTSSDPAGKIKKLSAEIANGRLAMMAIIGMFFQDGLTGSAWGDWALYTDSPMRAFESELGVQAPVGFFDPLGLCKDGDEDAFKRRRTTELKNGRVAMLACMGYIVPEYYRFPGFCSPSMGVKFADVPNGLAAISKIPGEGWFQWICFIGAIEKGLYPSETMTAPGDYPNGGVLGVPNGSKLPDGPTRKNKLNAELANGRLAMMAITGMWFQDGLTGSAWGDWSLYQDSPLRAFEGELGVQAPFGYWDPVGLSSDGDLATFKRRRETEIKHGRVAMWAAMGYIAPEYFRWPGFLSPSAGLHFTDVPNGISACSKVPSNGWAQVILFCGSLETYWGYNAYAKGGTPGDYGWKAITSTDPETKKRKLNAELANGRLAMMAVTGMFFQDGLTGAAWGDWALYADSPLRAFESELGVQAPLGYWDPVGYSKDGDAAIFKRRRETEIKHGRVAMFATMGYIVPEYVRFPGYLAPSEKIQFTDVPAGLSALSKVPSVGLAQIFLFIGLVDFCYLRADPARDAGDFANGGILGVPNGTGPMKDTEARKRKLNSELANGRLAMMAIMGMFFQDGLTGSAWGDWALFTASPLRAFDASKEVGAVEPLGFWDPAGISEGKDEAWFKKMRGFEIKHGRVAMMAIAGFLGQHFWRFPGCFDVPDGVAALKTMPASANFACLFLIAGFFELRILGERETEPGNFGDPFKIIDNKLIGGYDEKWRNFELNNGRLAMVGAIGTIIANGYTGLDAFQQWDEAKPVFLAYLKTTLPYSP